ncbi:predicted protein [Naegleria gruberi]|uniref:Predicted protein n=1 Tax=Naegleria gruberi TaxID=5762 RepID=D2VNB5_NAEGR|nr:uncharacterized protein NAEGRDRAFT_70437 [Naegleria gruberi]EFC41625.1 predicted protein [Naegleria gruberi]|eukprot:XP_002674369.1 predicted protein [Naegleria gruberi strain NEG-M]
MRKRSPARATINSPLTSDLRSFSATPFSQQQQQLNNCATRATLNTNLDHNSSTESSSNNDSSSSGNISEKPLSRHSRESLGTIYNEDSCQSNTNPENTNNSSASGVGGLSSFDSSFQHALTTQENLNEPNRSKKLDVLSADQIRQYFCYTQQDAARLLGVSVSTLKRRFYELKLGKRWPYKRTKQTPRKRKDKQTMSEERQLIDQGIKACSNVMILTPMKQSPVVLLMATSKGSNNGSAILNLSNGFSNNVEVSVRQQTPPSATSNMSQQQSVFDKRNLKNNQSSYSSGIEKQHKMNSPSSNKVLSPIKNILLQQHSNNSEFLSIVNRSRSSSNHSMSSSSVSSTNPNNQHHSSSNHSLQDEKGALSTQPYPQLNHNSYHPSSSPLNMTRNENSCKRETSMEQSRKKLSLSYILNHSDCNNSISSEQTS